MIKFIKAKQHGSIPGLAKLRKVAMLPFNKEDSTGISLLSGELRSYISQGLTLQILDPNKGGDFHHSDENADYYGGCAAHVPYADFWRT